MILQDGITGWRICLIDRGGCVAYECDWGLEIEKFWLRCYNFRRMNWRRARGRELR